MSDTIVFEGPDGRLYEVPAEVLGKYAVPGDQVAALRAKKLGGGPAASSPQHFRPGEEPPGIPPAPASLAELGGAAAAATSTTVKTPNGGAIVLNFFFGPGGPGAPGAGPHATAAATQVEGYHMTFDSHGIPSNHHEMLWGDYIDKQGHPAVGWHSHDPVSGNAQ